MNVNKILCPTDFSPYTDAALRYASDILARIRASLDTSKKTYTAEAVICLGKLVESVQSDQKLFRDMFSTAPSGGQVTIPLRIFGDP